MNANNRPKVASPSKNSAGIQTIRDIDAPPKKIRD
jgi:hypothetical protein